MRKQFVSMGMLLPTRAKRRLLNFAHAIADEDTRDDFRLINQVTSAGWSLRNLRRAGFVPGRVVDVGAYVGEWTRMIKQIFPESRVLMLEAQKSKEEILASVCREFAGTVSYEIVLLGSEPKEGVRFFELETGSSVFAERSSADRTSVSYPMRTLDDVLSCASEYSDPDFLKIDVQGYELEVLKGAARALESAQIVLMELSLISLNDGAPIMADVIAFMRERGFRPYDICSLIRRPLDNALWQSDFLFASESCPLVWEHSVD